MVCTGASIAIYSFLILTRVPSDLSENYGMENCLLTNMCELRILDITAKQILVVLCSDAFRISGIMDMNSPFRYRRVCPRS